MTPRILVTGAAGFIGRHCIAPLLSRGFEVHAVSSSARTDSREGVRWHRANLLKAADVARLVAESRPTHLLHLAWYVAPGRWANAPENYEWVQASLDLLRRFSEQGGQRVAVAGSCLEYDWTSGYCSEERTARRPHTFYGTCKNALHDVWMAYAALAGVSSVWGRIFFVYGPGEHPDRLVAHVVRSLIAGQDARCSHGRQVRDYLYVQDVADALAALTAGNISGAINIGSGEPVRLAEIIGRIGEAVGRPDLIRLGAIPAAPSDVPLVVADARRLQDEFGFHPAVDLARGLDLTITAWAAHQARPEMQRS